MTALTTERGTGMATELRRRITRSPTVRRRLVEYVFPDPATEGAIRTSLDAIPAGRERYAVLGCGIGWLAAELAAREPAAEVVGFDPDPTSIEVATVLFDGPRLSFRAGPGPTGTREGFDAIVPSPSAARSSDGVRRRGRADAARSALVSARLEMHVTSDGHLVSWRRGPSVLIALPALGRYSETFLRAQVERLPARVSLLIGFGPDMSDTDGRPLVPRIGRVSRRTIGRLLGGRWARRLDRFWLRRYLRRRRIEVVLAEYGFRGAEMLSTCQRVGIPLVTHFYGYDAAARPILERYERGYQRLFHHGDPLVVVSRYMADGLTAIGAEPADLHVIACGVDIDPGQPPPAFEDPPVFLAVGRFVEKKAPHLTILAFRKVVDDVPEARLVMVGDGPLLGPCRQLTKALGIEASIDFLGARPHEDLPGLYRASRAFVQHSMEASNGDKEGLPVAILEAGAAGLPVISTVHAGIPEAVIDGETGYLVPEGAIDRMADRMRQLAADRALAARLGTAARRRVAADFALDDSLDRLWAVIASTIDGPTSGSSHRSRHGRGG